VAERDSGNLLTITVCCVFFFIAETQARRQTERRTDKTPRPIHNVSPSGKAYACSDMQLLTLNIRMLVDIVDNVSINV